MRKQAKVGRGGGRVCCVCSNSIKVGQVPIHIHRQIIAVKCARHILKTFTATCTKNYHIYFACPFGHCSKTFNKKTAPKNTDILKTFVSMIPDPRSKKKTFFQKLNNQLLNWTSLSLSFMELTVFLL